MNCGSNEEIEDHFHIENTGYDYPFIKHQIDWFDKVRNCKVDEEIKNKLYAAHETSIRTGRKYTQLAITSLYGVYKTNVEESIYYSKKGKKFIIGNGYVIDNGMIEDESVVKIKSIQNDIATAITQDKPPKEISINLDKLYTRAEFEAMNSKRNGWAIAGGVAAAALGIWLASDDKPEKPDRLAENLAEWDFKSECESQSHSGSLISKAVFCRVESEYGWLGGDKKCVCQEYGL